MRGSEVRYAEAQGTSLDDPTKLQNSVGPHGKRFPPPSGHYLEEGRWFQDQDRTKEQDSLRVATNLVVPEFLPQ